MNLSRPIIALGGACFLALVAACAADKQAPLPTAKSSAESAATSPGVSPEDIAARTVADTLGIDASTVTIISVKARDFPDSSLDCPQPGMSYLQVITPGHRVLVEADGRRFDVRVAGQRGRICHRRKPADGKAPQIRVPELVSQARADLAGRLQVDPDSTDVSRVMAWNEGMQLPDCEPRCSADTQPCGYLIDITSDERSYRYFASDDTVMPCPLIANR